jgi:hypothetical protein
MIYFILVSIGLIVFHLFFIVFLAILIFKKTQTILLLIIWFVGFNDTIKKIPSILIFFLCFFLNSLIRNEVPINGPFKKNKKR